MQEIRELASGMKSAIASLKQGAVDAKGLLATEMGRAKVNNEKVLAMATDLKSANLEVEEFLGETRSNFPSDEKKSNTHQSAGTDAPKEEFVPTHADMNGVTLNKKD